MIPRCTISFISSLVTTVGVSSAPISSSDEPATVPPINGFSLLMPFTATHLTACPGAIFETNVSVVTSSSASPIAASLV